MRKHTAFLCASALILSACGDMNMNLQSQNEPVMSQNTTKEFAHLAPFSGPNNEVMYFCPPKYAEMAMC